MLTGGVIKAVGCANKGRKQGGDDCADKGRKQRVSGSQGGDADFANKMRRE